MKAYEVKDWHNWPQRNRSRYLGTLSLKSYILMLSLLLVPHAGVLFAGLRATDLMLLALIASTRWLRPYKQLPFWSFVICGVAITLSAFLGGLGQAGVEIERLSFVYKYLLLFLVPVIVGDLAPTERAVRRLLALYLFTFLLLVIWVYIYSYLWRIGYISGSFRPSFPFSENFAISDAHLLSSYLSISLVVTITYIGRRLRVSFIFMGIIFFLGVGAILLTGSRTGVLLLTQGLLLCGLFGAVSMSSISARGFLVGLLLSVLILVLLALSGALEAFLMDAKVAVDRSFNFWLTSDLSSLNRLERLKEAISEISKYKFLLGQGIIFSNFLWYDGIISILLAHGGLALVFGFLCYLSFFVVFGLRLLRAREFRFLSFCFLLCLSLIFVSNLITEYVLVTRNGFPTVLLASLIYRDIQLKRG